MRSYCRNLCLLSALLLSACASVPAHEALAPDVRDRIASTDVVVPISQSEIYVYVPPSNMAAAGASAGLIGALVMAAADAGVDSVRTSKAERAVRPLRDALIDYKFDAALQADLQSQLAQVPWIHADKVHLLKSVTSDSMDAALTASKDDAVLFASTDYRLSNDGDVLTMTVNAALYPNSDALRALKPAKSRGAKTQAANALYHNTVSFEYRLPNATDDRDRNIALWDTNGGAPARTALNTGAAKLAALLAQDLQGNVPQSDGAGSVVRADDGTLKYVASTVAQ